MDKAKYLFLIFWVASGLLFFSDLAIAKIDLVTLPQRKAVQLTIYNSADLTLVRDLRPLTLKKGINRLEFSWANTLIDPTSIDIEVKEQTGEVSLSEVEYPPDIQDTAIWKVDSEVSGKVPMEITYFTSGLSWNAFYLATLDKHETGMQLDGYVRVSNKSGEDYDQAKTRLVVGQINILDKIADLARRKTPYGKPEDKSGFIEPEQRKDELVRRAKDTLVMQKATLAAARPKEIKKQGLSEYFLYTIEGTESIKHNWSKRLPSFKADSVAVKSLYKYEKKRYGDKVLRFLKFKNDKEHNLGQTPLPGGNIQIFSQADQDQGLRYVGGEKVKYIPVKQDVEINLGPSDKVKVKPVVMDYKKQDIVFNEDGVVNGFEEVKQYSLKISNFGNKPVQLEIIRNMQDRFWKIENNDNPGDYEQIDEKRVKYELEVGAGDEEVIRYTLTRYHGDTRR